MASTKYFIKFKEDWKAAIEKQSRRDQWNPNYVTKDLNATSIITLNIKILILQLKGRDFHAR